MLNLTPRQIMLVAGCALVLIMTTAGLYGLLRGPAGKTAAPPDAATDHLGMAAGPAGAAITSPAQALPHTTDAIAYARGVAASVFNWDTTSGFLPTDYTATVLADADPSGEETPGLLADVATYVPRLQQWLDLGAMGVVQSIKIDDAYVPESWATAVAQAHGQLRPGTTAVTITGTRHRSGVWNGQRAESSSPVSLTVFVACQPSFVRCHVLRLSQLDNPLR